MQEEPLNNEEKSSGFIQTETLAGSGLVLIKTVVRSQGLQCDCSRAGAAFHLGAGSKQEVPGASSQNPQGSAEPSIPRVSSVSFCGVCCVSAWPKWLGLCDSSQKGEPCSSFVSCPHPCAVSTAEQFPFINPTEKCSLFSFWPSFFQKCISKVT